MEGNHAMDKPLFIPLKAKYFEQFESGEKTIEYRAYGGRWNQVTCYEGRPVTLSYGYGRARRLSGVVVDTFICDEPSEDFLAIYGLEKKCFAIKIKLEAHNG